MWRKGHEIISVFAKTATGRFTFCSDTQHLPKGLCYHVCYHENIFKFDYYLVSGNIVSDATDHFSQFCILQSTLPKATPERLSLLETILSSLIIDFVRDEHAPLRTLSKRKVKQLALSKP